MTRDGNQVRGLDRAQSPPNGLRLRWPALLLVNDRVGLGGLEPPASSLSAKCREPLCGPPFLQVTSDRRAQRYAFNRPTGMRSIQGLLGAA
jgi:hypothetical protein